MATADEILKIWSFVRAQYPQRKVDEALVDNEIDFWVEALAEFDAVALKKAAVQHVKRSKWYPTIAELVELAQREQDALDAERERTILWEQAQALFNAYLRGEISEQQLEEDKAWAWFERQRRPVSPDTQLRLDAAWELAQRQTAAWMAEDYGQNWRESESVAIPVGNWPVKA